MITRMDVLLGAQWGDEGKGKVVDVIAPDYDVIARFQGGPNAGHTLIFEGRKHVLHTIPSGVFRKGTMNLVGNGVVIDPVIFLKEVKALEAIGVDVRKSLLISRRAHLILPTHRALDAASEAEKGSGKIGSTLKGIGPTYMDKTGRNGLRVGDLERKDFKERYTLLVRKHERLLGMYGQGTELDPAAEAEWMDSIETLRSMTFVDSEHYIDEAMRNGKRVLAEGAQGTLLDIDFGTYPFVTSSNTISAGASIGLGVAPNRIGKIVGIFKAYCTRVGSGPFPTELEDATGEHIRKAGFEFGSTTGRPRRCGWLDLPALNYAVMINGVTELAMMKSDVLCGMDKVLVCTGYKVNGAITRRLPYDLTSGVEPVYEEVGGWPKSTASDPIPAELERYISIIEETVGVPVNLVSLGPDRAETIMRNSMIAH
ncbi:MAG: adenylosuccinate synthase [Flavobacteriales bacterium]|nr:adenylosuccinate synthase [Flavobacteriales bacterium]MBK7238882.1 adenylosuccinate synthase [Flavobacteriales bacterium]MBK7297542.1 adenylosuccinate synthase [Flavobacteriales bacterium]